MSDTLGASLALARAKLVYRSLHSFLNACCEWLNIEGHPFAARTRFWSECLQTFEGVPEVYPYAMALLDALGPGSRREIEWLPCSGPPRFRAAVGDVANAARDLIVVTWGWTDGHATSDLRELVAERRRTGMPSIQRLTAEMQALIDELEPEQRMRVYMPSPPLRLEIDPSKRDQFERIVRLELDHVKRFFIFKLAKTYYQSREFEDFVRSRAFDHIGDLDSYEREVRSKLDRPRKHSWTETDQESPRLSKSPVDRPPARDPTLSNARNVARCPRGTEETDPGRIASSGKSPALACLPRS